MPHCPRTDPKHTHSHFLAWHSPVLGHMIFTRPRASLPIDGRLGHPLLHMQLETPVSPCVFFDWWFSPKELGGTDSYWCSSYGVANPFSLLSTFSSSSIRGPVFPLMDDCEHPLLYLPGSVRASQKTAISGSHQQALVVICHSIWVWWLFMGWIPKWGSL